MTEHLFRVTIPKTNRDDGGADLRSRLQTWEWKWKLPAWATAVELDFRAVEFFEPWALALFTCYGLGLRHRTQVPVHAALDPQNPSNHYLQEMGIEEVLCGLVPPAYGPAAGRRTSIPRVRELQGHEGHPVSSIPGTRKTSIFAGPVVTTHLDSIRTPRFNSTFRSRRATGDETDAGP